MGCSGSPRSKYTSHRLEFFALKCDKFSHWLRDQQFSVRTDNNPLNYILTKPKLDVCKQRWVAKLAPYNFDIKYIPGPKNVVADALSCEPFVRLSVFHRLTRVPYGALLEESQVVNLENVQDGSSSGLPLSQPICKSSCKAALAGVHNGFNRTLGNMIRAIPPTAKPRWPQMLNSLTFCYNATIQETTGFPPFQLMCGRTSRLPIDMMFKNDYNQYVQSFRDDLAQAMKLAQSFASKQQQRQANFYNKKT
ncbi:Retrovirus-related Pol polyprotein from transposon 17.6 [Labeo rohita]|uniref:Retrovirus-related Pol polyprotein from transposon 17.6 n=1 Tax=Labeo rohita TaxID=84645 RepID=A0ABQ8L9W0_LABRO|nr:Retrovirus-related Pol polyprotein from transposon 17.6 [Labeo rohita]